MSTFKNKIIASLATISVIASGGAVTSSAVAQDCFVGEMRIWGGNFVPRGWLGAKGQLLPIANYTALFSLYGTTYGGDGRKTFALPDLQGRISMGTGRGPGLADYRLGQKIGVETTTLTAQNLPSHTHEATTTTTLKATTDSGNRASPAGSVLANAGIDRIYSSSTPDVTLSSGSAVSTTTVSATTGQATPIPNMQPTLTVTPIICVNGTYPSRS